MADGSDRTSTTPSKPLSKSLHADIPTQVLQMDHVFEALSHSRRRYLCYLLLEATEWTLSDFAVKIASFETDNPESEVSKHQRDQVYLALYHVHIPKLVEDDVVVFDEMTEVVRPGPNAQQMLLGLAGIGTILDAQQEAHARSEVDDDEA